MALILQTGFPALRMATQIVAVALGGKKGIIIIQSTQFIGVLGGQAGYLLVLNTAVGEVAEPAKRTGVFGQLQGCVMLGTSIGYLLGGLIGDIYGIRRPFDVAFFLFAIACLYAGTIAPYIDPATLSDQTSSKPKGIGAIFGPLRVLAPARLRLQDGTVTKHFGVLFLAMGVFLGVLATGYAPLLIQMYATAAFHFRPSDNGYLMSVNSLIRGLFLIFVFPSMISAGRRWFSGPDSQECRGAKPVNEASLPTHPEDFDPPQGILPELEPLKPPETIAAGAGCAFDLFFLRWSLVVDGLVTAYTAFATRSWHIYLAGFLLPLASGSAPASKGVITEMCPSSRRTDALQAMTLVESVAMLSTMGLFGFIFSAFSEVGKAYLTFYCNAAVALAAVCVLLLSRFPPAGSSMDISEDVQDGALTAHEDAVAGHHEN
ncbi:hypothetical protein LTR65_005101 [Meristemomyces frigidus]